MRSDTKLLIGGAAVIAAAVLLGKKSNAPTATDILTAPANYVLQAGGDALASLKAMADAAAEAARQAALPQGPDPTLQQQANSTGAGWFTVSSSDVVMSDNFIRRVEALTPEQRGQLEYDLNTVGGQSTGSYGSRTATDFLYPLEQMLQGQARFDGTYLDVGRDFSLQNKILLGIASPVDMALAPATVAVSIAEAAASATQTAINSVLTKDQQAILFWPSTVYDAFTSQGDIIPGFHLW